MDFLKNSKISNKQYADLWLIFIPPSDGQSKSLGYNP